MSIEGNKINELRTLSSSLKTHPLYSEAFSYGRRLIAQNASGIIPQILNWGDAIAVHHVQENKNLYTIFTNCGESRTIELVSNE